MWADPLPGGGTRVSFCIPSQRGRAARVAARRRRLTSSAARPFGAPVGPTEAGEVSSPARIRCACAMSLLGRGRHRRCLHAPPRPRRPHRSRSCRSTPDPHAVRLRHRRPGARRWSRTGGRPRSSTPASGSGGFVAAPRRGQWADIDRSAVGMSATWVDATRVGVPSDFYYLAANGPLLSRSDDRRAGRDRTQRVSSIIRPTCSRATATRRATSSPGRTACADPRRPATRWRVLRRGPGLRPRARPGDPALGALRGDGRDVDRGRGARASCGCSAPDRFGDPRRRLRPAPGRPRRSDARSTGL